MIRIKAEITKIKMNNKQFIKGISTFIRITSKNYIHYTKNTIQKKFRQHFVT